MQERDQVKKSVEDKLLSVGNLGMETLVGAGFQSLLEPSYTQELQAFFISLGKRFERGETVVQAFQAEIAAHSDGPLKQSLIKILEDYDSFSAGDSRLSSHMLARHRHLFPVSVLASMWKLEGELQELAYGLEPLAGNELADALSHWRTYWVSDYLGEFPDLRGVGVKTPTEKRDGLFESLEVALASSQIQERESALGVELLFVKNPGFSLRSIMQEIDEIGFKKFGRSIFLKDSLEIGSDNGVDEQNEDARFYRIVPVVPDTACRYTNGDLQKILSDRWSVTPGLLTDFTQDDILRGNNLQWVPRPLLAAAAGAYRLHYGFPNEGGIGLGNPLDYGDLFKGSAVFCAGAQAIGTSAEGIAGLTPGFSPAKIKTLGGLEFQTVAAGFAFSGQDNA